MEGNFRQGIVSPDLEVVVEESSAITVDDGCLNKALGNHANGGKFMEWTDEKHSLYLNSLESSFVKQLHRSIGIHGWRSQESVQGKRTSLGQDKNRISSYQFMVLDGRWQKINFEKNELWLDNTADSHTRHYTYLGKQCNVTSSMDTQDDNVLSGEGIDVRGNPTSSDRFQRSSDKNPVCHSCYQNLVGSITEVSDQNFVQKEGMQSSGARKGKKLKTASSDTSDNDQVVPSGNVGFLR